MEKETIMKELIATIRKRLECYNALIKLADEQKSILIDSRHSELPVNLAKFDPLLIEVKQCEKREESLLGHLDGISPGGEYAAVKGRVAEAAGLLSDLTVTNKQLLTSHMEYVNFSLGIIFKTVAEHMPADAGNNPAMMLDSKA